MKEMKLARKILFIIFKNDPSLSRKIIIYLEWPYIIVKIVYLVLDNFHHILCLNMSTLQILKVVKNEIYSFVNILYFKLLISSINQCYQI